MRKLILVVAMLMMVVMIAAAPALAQEKGKGKKDKATPETGGTLVDASILGLGAGALLVGSGLVVRRIVR
jgi:Na+-driven multidrug efflux pump